MSSAPERILSIQEAKVADLRKAVEKAQRELDIAQAVLHGMKLMYPAPDGGGPTAPPVVSGSESRASQLLRSIEEPPVKPRGRQPGAISHQWRDTCAALFVTYPDGFTEYNAATAAASFGLPNIRPKDALERMRAYVDLGYVEDIGGGKFRISDAMVHKYGFQTNGAPTADAEEAPEDSARVSR